MVHWLFRAFALSLLRSPVKLHFFFFWTPTGRGRFGEKITISSSLSQAFKVSAYAWPEPHSPISNQISFNSRSHLRRHDGGLSSPALHESDPTRKPFFLFFFLIVVFSSFTLVMMQSVDTPLITISQHA